MLTDHSLQLSQDPKCIHTSLLLKKQQHFFKLLFPDLMTFLAGMYFCLSEIILTLAVLDPMCNDLFISGAPNFAHQFLNLISI